MLAQHHVPFDNTGHVFMLGAEPGGLAGEHADDADPGLTFWAEPGDQPRLFQVFEWRSFLPVGGAAPIGEARSGPGPGGSCTNCPGSEQVKNSAPRR
jgi:hypothetical protein